MGDKREQFFADLQGDNRQLALLVVQVGAMPTELQLIMQVAEYDEAAGGLRPVRSYIVRVPGIVEHQISNLGVTTSDVRLLDDHPLLWQYTQDPTALFFKGQPQDPAALTLDIAQTHAITFQMWRHFPDYLNVSQPLETLLRSGGGLLGQMPRPFADRLQPVLERHGLETKAVYGTAEVKQAPGPLRDQPLQVLLIGDSYCIGYAFSFDEVGRA